MGMAKVLQLSTEGLRPEDVQHVRREVENLRMRRQIQREFDRLKREKGYGVYRAALWIEERYPVSESTARKIKYGE